MATAGGFGKVTGSSDGGSKAIRTKNQCRRDLHSPTGSFWHLRVRRTLPTRQDTSLQDHALTVKRLARIAYSDLLETQRRRYMLEDFTHSINHPSLPHRFQAKGVTSIEAGLQEGESYLQAERLYETPQQVTRL